MPRERLQAGTVRIEQRQRLGLVRGSSSAAGSVGGQLQPAADLAVETRPVGAGDDRVRGDLLPVAVDESKSPRRSSVRPVGVDGLVQIRAAAGSHAAVGLLPGQAGRLRVLVGQAVAGSVSAATCAASRGSSQGTPRRTYSG